MKRCGPALIGLTALVLLVAPARALCVGDCDGNGRVTIDEIVKGLNEWLNGGLSCPAMECNDGPLLILVNCATIAVGNALHGCGYFALDDSHPVALGAD